MTIIKLEDNTQFVIDTNNKKTARRLVKSKLKRCGDCRRIVNAITILGVVFRETNKRYNSGIDDNEPLRAWYGA